MPAIAPACSRAIVLVAVASCGRVDFDALALGDGAPDSAASCNPVADFGTPVLVPNVSDPSMVVGTFRLMPDELTGYFWRGNSGNRFVYVATRLAHDEPFAVAQVQGIPTGADNTDPTISSDGAVLVYRRSAPTDDLWVATRTGPSTVIDAMAISGTINTLSREAQPFLPIGRDDMYFESTRSGGGDIYVATRTGTTFSTPVLIPEIASSFEDGDPVVTPDGLTILFRSDRTSSIGGFNIYTATRPTTTAAFGPVTLVPNVNTGANDGPSWISADGCRLYISSDVAGLNDVYVATRGL